MAAGVLAGAAQASIGNPTITDCTSQAYAPSELTIACGDGNFGLTEMRWQGWGSAAPTGTGFVNANDCTPYCAAGHFHTYPVQATAGRIRTCLSGRRQYTQLALSYTGKRPPGAAPTTRESFPCDAPGAGPTLEEQQAGTSLVLTGTAWQRGAACDQKVSLSARGRQFAAVTVNTKDGFQISWKPPSGVVVIVARQGMPQGRARHSPLRSGRCRRLGRSTAHPPPGRPEAGRGRVPDRARPDQGPDTARPDQGPDTGRPDRVVSETGARAPRCRHAAAGREGAAPAATAARDRAPGRARLDRLSGNRSRVQGVNG